MHTRHWIPAYVGLGSNLDDPRAQVLRAGDALAQLTDSRFVLRSSLYRTPPFGPVEQPDFVNAVVAMLTQLDAANFLSVLKRLETKLGRQAPVVRWGPRVIDLDLLVHGTSVLDQPDITVPHPGLAQRAFVLRPLAEIAPDLLVPRVGRVASLLARVDASKVERLPA